MDVFRTIHSNTGFLNAINYLQRRIFGKGFWLEADFPSILIDLNRTFHQVFREATLVGVRQGM